MNRTMCRTVAVAAGAIGLMMTSGVANGTMVQYRLSNHPDGSARPPAYGFRLDELYNVTSGHDVFTFDFDHGSSNMRMDVDVDAGTIRLYGQSYGGRDTGTEYVNDAYLGVYEIEMMYSAGVSVVPGDDDVWSTAGSMTAVGAIVTPVDDVIPLTNMNMGGYTLRIGDEGDDGGHRGFDGMSGWGWVNHGLDPSAHVESSDWLFTATREVPAPGAGILAAMGLGLAGVKRRRRC